MFRAPGVEAVVRKSVVGSGTQVGASRRIRDAPLAEPHDIGGLISGDVVERGAESWEPAGEARLGASCLCGEHTDLGRVKAGEERGPAGSTGLGGHVEIDKVVRGFPQPRDVRTQAVHCGLLGAVQPELRQAELVNHDHQDVRVGAQTRGIGGRFITLQFQPKAPEFIRSVPDGGVSVSAYAVLGIRFSNSAPPAAAVIPAARATFSTKLRRVSELSE